MNWMTIALGLAMIAFGIVSSILRMTHPHLFRKLEPMKQRWGEQAGFWLHVFGYSIVPIVGGVMFVISGMRGGAIF